MFFFIFCSDGKLEVIVPSFVHYLEVLEGSDGDKVPGTRCYCLRNFFFTFFSCYDYQRSALICYFHQLESIIEF